MLRSISSTDKFMILWKSQEEMLSIDISHTYGGYVEAGTKITSSESKFGG